MLPSPLAKFLATMSPVACLQLWDRSSGGAVMLTNLTAKLNASKTNNACLQFMAPKVQQFRKWPQRTRGEVSGRKPCETKGGFPQVQRSNFRCQAPKRDNRWVA